MKKMVLFLIVVSLLLTACQSSDEGVVTGTRTRTEIRVSWKRGFAEDTSITLYYVQLDSGSEAEVTERVYSIVEIGDQCTFKGRKPYDSVSCIAPTSRVGDGQ